MSGYTGQHKTLIGAGSSADYVFNVIESIPNCLKTLLIQILAPIFDNFQFRFIWVFCDFERSYQFYET